MLRVIRRGWAINPIRRRSGPCLQRDQKQPRRLELSPNCPALQSHLRWSIDHARTSPGCRPDGQSFGESSPELPISARHRPTGLLSVVVVAVFGLLPPEAHVSSLSRGLLTAPINPHQRAYR